MNRKVKSKYLSKDVGGYIFALWVGIALHLWTIHGFLYNSDIFSSEFEGALLSFFAYLALELILLPYCIRYNYKYTRDDDGLSFFHGSKKHAYVKWEDIVDCYHYNATTYEGRRLRRNLLHNYRADVSPMFCMSSTDLSGYKDKSEFMHMCMLSFFAKNFKKNYASELYCFTVLYLIPCLDKPYDENSLISQVVNTDSVRQKLTALKREYEKQNKLNILQQLTYGWISCGAVSKSEYELYNEIRKLPVIKDMMFVAEGMSSGQKIDDAVNIAGRIEKLIPDNLINIAREKEVLKLYDDISELEFVDLGYKSGLKIYDHFRKAEEVSNRIPDNEKSSFSIFENNHVPKYKSYRPILRIGYSILLTVIGALILYPLLRLFTDYRVKALWIGMIFFYNYYYTCRTRMFLGCFYNRDGIVCAPWKCMANMCFNTNNDRFMDRDYGSKYVYTYSYASIVEYGTFRRAGKKYIYFAKKHIQDSEIDELKKQLNFANEYMCAMIYNRTIDRITDKLTWANRVDR